MAPIALNYVSLNISSLFFDRFFYRTLLLILSLANVLVKMQFAGVPMEKDGKTYMKVEKFRMDLEPKGMHFKIDNLFNGDKALGDNMNLFLNENWQDIYRELRASITSAFGKVFHTVIGHVFTKYPYEDFFAQ